MRYRFPLDDTLLYSDVATEEKLATKLDCSADSALDRIVAFHLDRLAEGQVATVDFCARTHENFYSTQHRMHAMFGQCQINAFNFSLIENDSVENWLRLYAAAIRCSIQPCGRGFVFVTWVYMDGNVRKIHATALYFDSLRKTQVFIDPSGCLKRTNHGNLLQHFRESHVWVPKVEKPDVSTTRAGPVCCWGSALSWTQKIQQYFHGPIEHQQEILDTNGCCTTMVLLVVWMCLRFGCRDPHQMVKSIRCAMGDKRRGAFLPEGTLTNARKITEFLLRLRAWQNGILKHDLNTEEIKHWLKIYADPGTVVCNYMLYNKQDPTEFIGLCPKPCEGGFTWCAEHAAGFRLGNEETPVVSNDVKVLHVPAALKKHCVLFAGYFERRWGAIDDWECSQDTFIRQLRAVPDIVEQAAKTQTDTMGTLRFYGFLGPDGLHQPDLDRILTRMQSHMGDINSRWADVFSVELLLPEPETVSPRDRFLFCKMVSERQTLQQWPISVVYVKKAIGILVVDMNFVDSHIDLVRLLARYLPLNWHVPHQDEAHPLRFLIEHPYPRDSGIDSVVPLVVFRVHTPGHLDIVNWALNYAANLSSHIRMHVQFAPGEWDGRRVAEWVTFLIQRLYDLDRAAAFWTPTWFDNGNFREHLHGYKLYFTVSEEHQPTAMEIMKTTGKRKLHDTDATGWKIYAEGFVADAILKHKHDIRIKRNTVDMESMKALIDRDLTLTPGQMIR